MSVLLEKFKTCQENRMQLKEKDYTVYKQKKVLLIGPSKAALRDFDYTIINDYDYIARTNKFLECDLTGLEGKCDLLFINSNSVQFYLKQPHKLINYKVFVKGDKPKKQLLDKINTLDIVSLEKYHIPCMSFFKPTNPYYGTIIMDYLSNVYQSVDVCGIDFYTSGPPSRKNYLENYYDLKDLKAEESTHSIKRDVEYTKMLLESRDNIKLLYGTKHAFEEVTK